MTDTGTISVTVTKSEPMSADTMLICEWCGDPFPRGDRRGPIPRYCKPVHKQRAYEARGGAGATGWLRIRVADMVALLDGNQAVTERFRLLIGDRVQDNRGFLPPEGTPEWGVFLAALGVATSKAGGKQAEVPARWLNRLRAAIEECKANGVSI